ncbi:type II secretion system minor pseudopilin [Tepidiphilus sp. HLB4]
MSSPRAAGLALPAVLWLVVALSLTLLGLTLQTRQQIDFTRWYLDQTEARLRLDAALSLTAQALTTDPRLGERYTRLQWRIGEDSVLVAITSANGLVNLNVADEIVLQTLLARVGGLAPADAAILACRIRDWIDPDDLPSCPGGAEAAQYLAAGWPSLPRNGPMDDPSDLLAVLGFDRSVYDKIKNFIGREGRNLIDVRAAPPDLLDAFTGEPNAHERIRAMIETNQDPVTLGVLDPAVFAPLSQRNESLRYRLQAELHTADGRRWRRTVWIDRNARPDTLTPWTTETVDPVELLPPDGVPPA